MPLGASSWRMTFVMAHAAVFAALYAPYSGTCSQESTERTLRIAPPPLAARIGSKASGDAQRAEVMGLHLEADVVGVAVGQARVGRDACIVDEQRRVGRDGRRMG